MVANPFATERFDRAKWLTGECSGHANAVREPMAEDIRRRFLRVGVSKHAVRALLGASNNSEADEEQGNVDSYLLGCRGDMSMDPTFLVIHYDRSGRIASTEIYEY